MSKTIRLTDEVDSKVKKISKRLDMPKAQVVNMLCNEWLENNKEK